MSTDLALGGAAAPEAELPHRKAWPAYLCALVVFAAIVLEFVGGRGGPAISPHHHRSISPSSWPDGARVGWWLFIAAVAGTYRGLADWIERRPVRIWLVVLTAAPFVFFAIGIASSASWATFR